MNSIPLDIQRYIFSYLDLVDLKERLLSYSIVCKSFHMLCWESSSYWKRNRSYVFKTLIEHIIILRIQTIRSYNSIGYIINFYQSSRSFVSFYGLAHSSLLLKIQKACKFDFSMDCLDETINSPIYSRFTGVSNYNPSFGGWDPKSFKPCTPERVKEKHLSLYPLCDYNVLMGAELIDKDFSHINNVISFKSDSLKQGSLDCWFFCDSMIYNGLEVYFNAVSPTIQWMGDKETIILRYGTLQILFYSFFLEETRKKYGFVYTFDAFGDILLCERTSLYFSDKKFL